MSKKPLEIKTRKQSIKEALGKIKESMYEEYPGLRCRWDSVNNAMGKVFRFGEIISTCGLSGSGKSFFINMIREDFANPELNEHIMEKKPFKILAFSLEMASADEVLRTLSSEMKVSYSDLLSMKERITEDFFNQIRETAKRINNDIIHYVEDPGDPQQILDTIHDFTMNKFPDHNIVVTIDHTLLVEMIGDNENKLISDVMRVCRLAKKRYGALMMPVGQLRDDIEKPERVNPQDPNQHYPKRWDIYGSRKIYMDSDGLMVIHRPNRLGIQEYGPKKYPCTFGDGSDLVALHVLKGRLTGIEGIIRFKNKFSQGTMEYIPSENKEKLNLKSNPFSNASK